MKFSITKHIKLWITLVVAVLVVGLTMLGVFGFNNGADYTDSYEAVVSMDTQASSSTEEFRGLAEDYLNNKNLVFNRDVQEVDGPIGGYSLIYKFDSDVKLDKDAMKEYISSKISDSDIIISVEYNAVLPLNNQKVWKTVLALGIIIAVIFVYLAFMEKIASTLSVLIASVISSLLFISLSALCRVPANATISVMSVLAFLIASLLSVGLVNRFKEEKRLNDSVQQSSEKLSYNEIADKSAKASLLRYAFVLIGLLVAGILFIVLGNSYVKFIGLQIVLVDVCSVFASLVVTSVVWPKLKSAKKKRT